MKPQRFGSLAHELLRQFETLKLGFERPIPLAQAIVHGERVIRMPESIRNQASG